MVGGSIFHLFVSRLPEFSPSHKFLMPPKFAASWCMLRQIGELKNLLYLFCVEADCKADITRCAHISGARAIYAIAAFFNVILSLFPLFMQRSSMLRLMIRHAFPCIAPQ